VQLRQKMGATTSRPAPRATFASVCALGLALGVAIRLTRPSVSQAVAVAASPTASAEQAADAAHDAGERSEDDAVAATSSCSATAEPSAEARTWARDLVSAAAAGEREALARLLDDAPVNEDASLERLLCVDAELSASWTNVTCVGAAALNGHAATLEVLLAKRADPNIKCQNASSWDGAFTLTQRDTPLCLAAKKGHRACVETLLRARADPNVQCNSEYLEGAVEWGEDDDGTETMFYSALDVANMAKQPEIAELIGKGGGTKLAQPSNQPRRKMVSSGNRMGA